MKTDEFMSAKDLRTGESFRRFAVRRGFSRDEIEGGRKWQERVDALRQSKDQPKATR